ncbi:MAG: ABC transporter ATP-binding protein [Bacteroidota bacterium]
MSQSTVSGKAFDTRLFSRVMEFVKPFRGKFYLTAILTILLGFLGPYRVDLTGDTVDHYIAVSDAPGLLKAIIVILALLVVETIMQFYQTWYANWLGQSVTIDIRSKLFAHISKFKLSFFDNTPIGTLVTRVISDIETIGEIFSQGLLIIVGDLLKLVVVLVYMFWLDWKLALLSVASVPLLLVATNMFKNSIKASFADVRIYVARLNAFVQEHVTGMSIVQIFNREEVEGSRFRELNKEHMDAHNRSNWANSIFFPLVELFSAISLALVLWWGVKGIVSEGYTFGTLFKFIMLINMLFRPIRQLADRFNVLQMGMVGSERVFGLLDTEAAIADTGSDTTTPIAGNIEFRQVWFAYVDEEYVLRDLSFSVKAGQSAAFVGATGAGKSSVISLINRMYEFQQGSILVDGKDIRDFDLAYLRRNVAVVLQDVFLFSDTIYNNVTLKDPSITLEQVIEAAKAVGAHDFIMKLPGRYDYDVKERGAMLSVGQRQLIAFIRAYVYNPKILILDEATSSVDTESEQLIQRAIEKITEGRTSIIIAHRLSTIQRADQIIVMEKGKVIESGSHQELLAGDGHYKTLFDLQYKD